jgi:hypothetical protein
MNIIRKVSTGKASLFSTYWFVTFFASFASEMRKPQCYAGRKP